MEISSTYDGDEGNHLPPDGQLIPHLKLELLADAGAYDQSLFVLRNKVLALLSFPVLEPLHLLRQNADHGDSINSVRISKRFFNIHNIHNKGREPVIGDR